MVHWSLKFDCCKNSICIYFQVLTLTSFLLNWDQIAAPKFREIPMRLPLSKLKQGIHVKDLFSINVWSKCTNNNGKHYKTWLQWENWALNSWFQSLNLLRRKPYLQWCLGDRLFHWWMTCCRSGKLALWSNLTSMATILAPIDYSRATIKKM